MRTTRMPLLRTIALLWLSLSVTGPLEALQPRTEPGPAPERVKPDPELKPDLRIGFTLLDDRPPKAVTISNKGSAVAGPSVLRFSCEPTDGQPTACPFYGKTQPLVKTIPLLTPGASHEVLILDAQHPWIPRAWPCGTYRFTAIADAQQQVRESNEGNNRGELGIRVGCGDWSNKKTPGPTTPR